MKNGAPSDDSSLDEFMSRARSAQMLVYLLLFIVGIISLIVALSFNTSESGGYLFKFVSLLLSSVFIFSLFWLIQVVLIELYWWFRYIQMCGFPRIKVIVKWVKIQSHIPLNVNYRDSQKTLNLRSFIKLMLWGLFFYFWWHYSGYIIFAVTSIIYIASAIQGISYGLRPPLILFLAKSCHENIVFQRQMEENIFRGKVVSLLNHSSLDGWTPYLPGDESVLRVSEDCAWEDTVLEIAEFVPCIILSVEYLSSELLLELELMSRHENICRLIVITKDDGLSPLLDNSNVDKGILRLIMSKAMTKYEALHLLSTRARTKGGFA